MCRRWWRPGLGIHGGGPFISQRMKELGKEPVFVRGRRVTDEETLRIAESVLVDLLNARLVEESCAAGARAVGIHPRGASCLLARKMDPVRIDGELVDLGFVGEVVEVMKEVLLGLCQEGVVPVVAPLALDRSGQLLNINADSVAAAIAAELVAEKLVFMSDTHGILRDPNDPESLVSTIHEQEVDDRPRGDHRRNGAQGGGLPGRPPRRGEEGSHRRRAHTTLTPGRDIHRRGHRYRNCSLRKTVPRSSE